MRRIDADAFKQQVCAETVRQGLNVEKTVLFCMLIDAQPTIDAEPVRPGGLPCSAGDRVYWFWCDSDGSPCGGLEEETVLELFIDKEGVGIRTKPHDGSLGHFVEEGALIDGVRRVFFNKDAACAALGKEGMGRR